MYVVVIVIIVNELVFTINVALYLNVFDFIGCIEVQLCEVG